MQKEQSNQDEHLNLENMRKDGKELVEMYDVADSPMKIVGNEEQGYALVMGKYRVTDWYYSKEFLIGMDTATLLSTVFKMIATMIGDNEAEKLKQQTINDKYKFQNPIEGNYHLSTDEINNPERIKGTIDPEDLKNTIGN